MLALWFFSKSCEGGGEWDTERVTKFSENTYLHRMASIRQLVELKEKRGTIRRRTRLVVVRVKSLQDSGKGCVVRAVQLHTQIAQGLREQANMRLRQHQDDGISLSFVVVEEDSRDRWTRAGPLCG